MVLAPTLMLAQDAPPTIKVDVDVVNILFNVRDKKGGLIGNLEKGDFSIYEDGKQQDIKYFNRETDLPLTIGLLIDISASQGNLIEIEKDAASQFFGQVLRSKDLAFLISFGPDCDLLQDYTNSPRLLRAGLDGLKVNTDFVGLHPGPVPTIYQPKGTVLYDAVYLAASDQLKGQVGRKVLVLITDGEDEGSHYKIKDAIDAAQRAETLIYTIMYSDGGFNGDGKHIMESLAKETGGAYFEVSKKFPIDQVYALIEEDLRSEYSIGYVSDRPATTTEFRKIQLTVKRPGLVVQCRDRYWAEPPG